MAAPDGATLAGEQIVAELDEAARERRIDLISLDAGGVLVVPHQGLISRTLERAGVDHDYALLARGHYQAMAALDLAGSAPEDFTDYLEGFLDALGVVDAPRDAALVALGDLFGSPIFCQPAPGARAGLAHLVDMGIRLAVTSNSDGSVARVLGEFEVLQEGEGAGTRVEAIVDSGVVGAAKPDPAIFIETAQRTGVPIERMLHVGDSMHYDVHGATAAGALGVHFDPWGLAPDDGLPRVGSLAELVRFVVGPTNG